MSDFLVVNTLIRLSEGGRTVEEFYEMPVNTTIPFWDQFIKWWWYRYLQANLAV